MSTLTPPAPLLEGIRHLCLQLLSHAQANAAGFNLDSGTSNQSVSEQWHDSFETINQMFICPLPVLQKLTLELKIYIPYPSLEAVLGSSGCYNKRPETGWLIRNRNLLLAVLEAGKVKIKVLADSVSGENPFSGSW